MRQGNAPEPQVPINGCMRGVYVLTISFAKTVSHLPLVFLRATHRLSDQCEVVHLHKFSEDEVHLALVQTAPDMSGIPEVVPMQIALKILHLLEVDSDVRGHLGESGLRLVHFEHLESDRVVVRAHRSDPALEHYTSLKGQVRGISGRTVFAPLHLEESFVATSVLVRLT